MDRPQGIRRFFRRKSVLAINLGVLVLIGWGFAGEFVRNREMETEIERLSTEATQLESRNLELATLAKRLSEPEMLEREARLKLNLQKPGEEVVVIRDLSPAKRQVESEVESSEIQDVRTPTDTNARKWVEHFFK